MFDFAGTAGILNWMVAIGPDTLKSRFQTGKQNYFWIDDFVFTSYKYEM